MKQQQEKDGESLPRDPQIQIMSKVKNWFQGNF
jgi:hypothetical protein